MLQLNTFDFYHKPQQMRQVLDAYNKRVHVSYPPCNIIKFKESSDYKITMAVAGFAKEDITVTIEKNILRVNGETRASYGDEVEYIMKGLSNKPFTREFILGEHTYIKNVTMNNGLLSIDIYIKEPDELKPRKLEIND